MKLIRKMTALALSAALLSLAVFCADASTRSILDCPMGKIEDHPLGDLGMQDYGFAESTTFGDYNYHMVSSEDKYTSADQSFVFREKTDYFMATPCTYAAFYKSADHTFHVWLIDKDTHSLKNEVVIHLPLKFFGGMYVGRDSQYYLAVGQLNEEKSADKPVIKVLRFNSSWEQTGEGTVYGDDKAADYAPNIHGIVMPFANGCSMTETQDYLVLHTSRIMFSEHQSSLTVFFKKGDLSTRIMPKVPYTSHSFNQFVEWDPTPENANRVAFVDHGDGYPRQISLNVLDGSKLKTYSVMDIPGQIGDNYTGVNICGFKASGGTYLVVGSAEPQKTDEESDTGYGFGNLRNVFVAKVNKYTMQTEITWLTHVEPSNWKERVSIPRVSNLDGNIAISYNHYSWVGDKWRSRVVITAISDVGSIINTRSYQNDGMPAFSSPGTLDDSLAWLDTRTDKNGSTVTTLRHISRHIGSPRMYDFDLDGKVTILDATLLQRYLADLEEFSNDQLWCSISGNPGIRDVTQIQRIVSEEADG